MPRNRPLSKTQLQLLAELDTSRLGRLMVEQAWGKGPDGGKVSFGRRRVHAARDLELMGLLERIGRDKSMEAQGNGNNIHYTLISYRRPAAKEA